MEVRLGQLKRKMLFKVIGSFRRGQPRKMDENRQNEVIRSDMKVRKVSKDIEVFHKKDVKTNVTVVVSRLYSLMYQTLSQHLL